MCYLHPHFKLYVKLVPSFEKSFIGAPKGNAKSLTLDPTVWAVLICQSMNQIFNIFRFK